MPEFTEAEAYRRTAAPLVGAAIEHVEVLDPRLLRRSESMDLPLEGSTITDVRRHGKVVLVDLHDRPTLALAFGLRGRLLLDRAVATTEHDRFRPVEPVPSHIRLRVAAAGRILELEDQLRLATAELGFDVSRLGVDVLDLDEGTLARLVGCSTAAIKSRLMDQRVVAGIGNLLADEILFRAGIHPSRPGDDLGADELSELMEATAQACRVALAAGGSHHGEFIWSGARTLGAHCLRCDVEVERVRVGGRTTFLCPTHQVRPSSCA